MRRCLRRGTTRGDENVLLFLRNWHSGRIRILPEVRSAAAVGIGNGRYRVAAGSRRVVAWSGVRRRDCCAHSRGWILRAQVESFFKVRKEGSADRSAADAPSARITSQPNQEPTTDTPRAPITAQATQQPTRLPPGEIAAKFSSAVVVLENYDERGQRVSQGSGFIYAPQGKVLTNYHVIRGASRMVARMRDGSTAEVQHIAGYDLSHDIAAVEIEGSQLPYVRLGDSSTVKTGDHVTVLGAPLGLNNTLSDGIISAVREGGSLRVFQTTAPISHGSSGGPLFDDYGNVIAIAMATMEGGENLNFAMSIDSAKPILTREESIGFGELLSATAVHQQIVSSSFSLPPQQASIDVVVPQQGGKLVGSLRIAGGLGNDLGVRLVAENGALLWNGGVVSNFANLNIPLRGGRYKLVFDNKIGPLWVSNKTISGAVELTYYR